jgi:hypothetical protein
VPYPDLPHPALPYPAPPGSQASAVGARTRAALTVGVWTIGLCWLGGLGAGCATGVPGDHSTPREYTTDRATTAKVEKSLDRDRSLQSFDFNVETVDGTVELNGYVDRPAQSAAADRDAARIAGVTSVQNDIVIRPVPRDQPAKPVSKDATPVKDAPAATGSSTPPSLPPQPIS